MKPKFDATRIAPYELSRAGMGNELRGNDAAMSDDSLLPWLVSGLLKRLGWVRNIMTHVRICGPQPHTRIDTLMCTRLNEWQG